MKKIFFMLLPVFIVVDSILIYDIYSNSNKKEYDIRDIKLLSYTFENKRTKLPIETLIDGLGTLYMTSAIECNEGTVATINKWGNVTFSEMEMPVSCSVNFESLNGTFLVDKILEDNPTVLTVGGSAINGVTPRTGFNVIDNQTYINTIYQTNNAELGQTVYYYSGNVTNNWVIFGTCKDSSYNCTVGDDLYWRIIRINEEGTGGGVRLLYAGSGLKLDANNRHVIADNVTNARIKTNGNSFSATSINFVSSVRRGAGYTYGSAETNLSTIRGTTGSNSVKSAVTSWYSAQFPETTDSFYRELLDNKAVYCNDRSTNSVTSPTSSFGSYTIYNGAYRRLKTNKAPSYACGATNEGYGNWYVGGNDNADRYTGESYEYGNGILSNTPVALMTADEVVFAGGLYNSSNSNFWVYANKEGNSISASSWWTLSPAYSTSEDTYIFKVTDGLLDYTEGIRSLSIRPVLSLDSETLWLSGDGTANNPYMVVTR